MFRFFVYFDEPLFQTKNVLFSFTLRIYFSLTDVISLLYHILSFIIFNNCHFLFTLYLFTLIHLPSQATNKLFMSHVSRKKNLRHFSIEFSIVFLCMINNHKMYAQNFKIVTFLIIHKTCHININKHQMNMSSH